MTMWADIKAFIHEQFKVEDLSDDVMKLVFQTGDARIQIVFVTHYALMGGAEDWVSIEAPFWDIASLDMARALEETEKLVCGGLSRIGPKVTLKHAAPLANLDPKDLERPLGLILKSADTLEKVLAGGDTI